MGSITTFAVDPVVFEAVPSYRRVVLLATVNGMADAVLVHEELLQAHEVAIDLIDQVGGVDQVPAVVSWRNGFRAAGLNPSRRRPAVDALLRRVARGDIVAQGVPLVDAGTAVAIRYGVPVGVHVVDDLDGEIVLRPAEVGDRFVGFDGAEEPPDPGELVWACGTTVLTRCWAWRQGPVGSVTDDATQLAVNVDLLDGADPSAVDAMAALLTACGAVVHEIVTLDVEHSAATIESGATAFTDPLLAELDARSLVAQCTDPAGLDARMAEGPVTLYVGIDPTASSLHVGSLLPLTMLRRFQARGHQVIVVVGSATGFIGDPSGRRTERTFLDDATLDANRLSLHRQLEALLPQAAGTLPPIVVDNRDWLGEMRLLEFLRDVGRHFPVGEMLGRDSVRSRMASESGISFTEFSYSLLQAYDFAELAHDRGCDLQAGGSDQWGNIVAGIDFARRRDGARLHGLVWPLLTRANGEKFGKSGCDNVWLEPDLTSPWQFWQFWVNVGDDDVTHLLRRLSFLPLDEVDELVAAHGDQPERRSAQRALADQMTAWVHGPRVLGVIHEVAEALFGAGTIDVSDPAVVELLAVELPTTVVGEGELPDVADLLVATGLVRSRSAAARLVRERGVRLNGVVPDDALASSAAFLATGACLVQRGARTHRLVLLHGAPPLGTL